MNRRLLTLLAVLAILAAGCGSDTIAEQIIESNDGITDVNIDDDEVTIEFDDEEGGGSLTFGGGEIPDGLPIPVPGGGTVQTSFEQSGSYAVGLAYPGEDFDDLAEFYGDWVASQDAQNVSTSSTTNPRSQSWFGERADGEFIITLVEVPDGSGNPTVQVSLNWTTAG